MSTILTNCLRECGSVHVKTFLSAGKGCIKLTVIYDHCTRSKTAVFEKSFVDFKKMTDSDVLTWQARCVLSLLQK